MTQPPPARIVTQDGDKLSLAFDLASEHPVFLGHFPSVPVLPGVAQIDWAMAFAERHAGLGQHAARAFQVKFSRIVAPPTQLELELRIDRTRARLHFVYRNAGRIASSGSIVLDPP